jgi:hypothetical protein
MKYFSVITHTSCACPWIGFEYDWDENCEISELEAAKRLRNGWIPEMEEIFSSPESEIIWENDQGVYSRSGVIKASSLEEAKKILTEYIRSQATWFQERAETRRVMHEHWRGILWED